MSSSKANGAAAEEEIAVMPKGFKFVPTEKELLGYYLLNKLKGEETIVKEYPIYSDAPWNVFTDDQSWSQLNDNSDVVVVPKKMEFYAFARLRKKGKQSVRNVGCGRWHGQTGPKRIEMICGGKSTTLGWMKMLTFELYNNVNIDVGSSCFGHWIMHEYYLDEDFLKKKGLSFLNYENYVICHVTRDDSKSVKMCKEIFVVDHHNKADHETNVDHHMVEANGDNGGGVLVGHQITNSSSFVSAAEIQQESIYCGVGVQQISQISNPQFSSSDNLYGGSTSSSNGVQQNLVNVSNQDSFSSSEVDCMGSNGFGNQEVGSNQLLQTSEGLGVLEDYLLDDDDVLDLSCIPGLSDENERSGLLLEEQLQELEKFLMEDNSGAVIPNDSQLEKQLQEFF